MEPAAARVAGHLGELIQGRLGPAGPVALVTLPCGALGVTARLTPGARALRDPARLLRRRDAEALLAHGLGGAEEPEDGGAAPRDALGGARRRGLPRREADASAGGAGASAGAGGRGLGRLRLDADMPAGGGAGASTAARLAVLRVAARASGAAPPSAETAARLCLAQEGATDPLMFAEPASRLWASRLGRTLAPLPPLPRFEVVGGFEGPPRRTDPADQDFADVTDLAAAWGPAAARGDLRALAALATVSAERHEARGRVRLDALRAVARAHGALGLAVAHTGSARALLFAPGAGDPFGAVGALRVMGLRGVLRFRAGGRP